MRMLLPICLVPLITFSGLSVSCDSEPSGGSAVDGDGDSAVDGDGDSAVDGDGDSAGDGDGDSAGDGDGDSAVDGDGDSAVDGDGDSAGDGDGDSAGDGDGDSAGDGDGDSAVDGDDDGGMSQTESGDGDGSGGGDLASDAGGDGGTDGGAGGDGDGDGGDGFNGCFVMDAVDMRGMSSVTITDLDAWTVSHAGCLRVSVGTAVTWQGNFQFHPISGGLTPNPDASSPITLAGPGSGTDPVVVHFAEPGGYPYFCTVHNQTMQGTVYVQ